MIVLTTSRVCSSKPPLSGCSENAMAAIDDEKIHIEKRPANKSQVEITDF